MHIDNVKDKKGIIHHSDYIANHYGFDLVDVEEKVFKEGTLVEDEKLLVLKSFSGELAAKRTSPLKMFFYKKPVVKKQQHGLGIDIINVPTPIAEATVIKTAISILTEEGYSGFTIVLNAIGDKESQKNFKNALTEYYRTVIEVLKITEVKKITKDPLSIYYDQDKQYLEEINAGGPSAMQFLSEKSINHFQETIKFLESFGIEYVIDETMMGSKMFFSKIIFKILAIAPGKKEQDNVGFGGRYDEIAEQTIKKKKVSAIGLTLNFIKKNTTKLKLTEKKVNLHLLKIGSTSKLKYLEVVDALAKISAPVYYDINENKISAQVRKAMDENIDYAIILGETEAKKDKVIVRRMVDFSQKEVYIKDIGKYIKKLIK
jgi:histidyl-tRNA synthetase